MTTFAGEVTDTISAPGLVLPVTVYDAGTETPATLYADRARSVSLANPLPVGVAAGAAGVDAVGNYTYWAAPGVYDEWILGAKVRTVTVPLDPAEPAGGGGAPSGPAGGALGGSYPNPSFAADMATQAELDAHTGATTAAHGGLVASSDARLTDTRTPTDGSVTDVKVSASAAIAESKLSLASDAAAGTASRRTLGTGATQAAAGNDSRLSDARTPTSHAASHKSGGSDAVKLNELAAPTATVALNAQKITGLADGAAVSDAATVGQIVVNEFEIVGLTKAVSNVNYATFTQSSGRFLAFERASSNAQNDEVVFQLPIILRAGTWTLALTHHTANNNGIYTLAMSADAAAWTDIATFDGYAASAAATRTEVTGLTVAAGMAYVRLKMATKNGSSTNYGGRVNGIFGIRTGA